MGDSNQFSIVEKNVALAKDPILEVGSKLYGERPDMRSLFPDRPYVGADMEKGPGVDVLADFTDELALIKRTLPYDSFGTVICFSVLEHCARPFDMARNITALLRPGGTLFVSVPFVWNVHAYPSDYWRFTADGVKMLFPEIDFTVCLMSTSKPGEIRRFEDRMFAHTVKHVHGLRRKVLRLCIWLAYRLGALPSYSYPYVFPPILINMIGHKRAP